MASFEPIIRIDENSFRAPEKFHPRKARKPLSDMSNSRNPLVKEKSLVKNFNVFKASEKLVQPKVGRKPLGDLTNSSKPPAQEKTSKKNYIENRSAVSKDKGHSFAAGEGFLHNHNDCIKAHQQSLTMSLDYFLETVALKRDSTPVSTPRLPQLSRSTKLELDIPMEIDEMEIEDFDFCAPLSPEAARSPGSPCWSMELKNLEFSPLKLKESPVKG